MTYFADRDPRDDYDATGCGEAEPGGSGRRLLWPCLLPREGCDWLPDPTRALHGVLDRRQTFVIRYVACGSSDADVTWRDDLPSPSPP